MHSCIDTLTSFRCECYPGYKLVDRFRCVDIDECRETPYVCSQLCENRPGGYTCKCAEGFERQGSDARFCKIIGTRQEAYLIFTNNYYLRNISLSTSSYNLVKDGFNSARGVAYDFNRSVIYVADGGSGSLVRLWLNGTSDTLIPNLRGDERGLAFDWYSKILYILNSDRLTVCDSDGHFRSTIVDNKVLQEATSIVIDPRVGFIFITDWNFPPFIARLRPDGSNLTKIITEDLGSPIGLTIDLITKRIFWTDIHLRRIELSNYNGRNRFAVLQSNQAVYPFAIAFFDANLYWSDRSDDSIYSAYALSAANKTTIKQGTIHSAYAMTVYHNSLQPEGNLSKTIN